MSELKVLQENFTLQKVKIDGKKIIIDFQEKRLTKSGTNELFNHTVDSDSCLPHQDLLSALSSLRETLMRSLRYYDVYEFVKEFIASKDKKKADDCFLDVFQDVEITGISIGGNNQLRGAVITGKIKNEVSGKSSLNSPRIVFSSDKLGYEKQVKDLSEIIEREVYNYLYKGKKAQKELFDSKDDNKKKGVLA